MRKILLSIVGFLLVIAAFFAIYRTSSQMTPTLVMKSSSMTDAPLTLQEITTPSGYSIWLAPSEIPVVSVGLIFLGAGHRNTAQQPGLVHLLTALLDEGAGPYDSQAFKRELLEKNIQLSISANQDHLIIRFRTIKENVKEAMRLVHLMLTDPLFEETDVQRVKQQVAFGLEQSLHHPRPVGQEALQKFLLGTDHPYNPKTTECVKNIPLLEAGQLREYMKKYFTKGSVKIAVAGSITGSELSTLIDKTLQELKETKEEPLPKTSYQNLGKTLEITMDIPQTFVCFAQPGLDAKHPDFYALFLVNSILSNAFESRLWHEVREKRGLAYFCTTGLSSAVLSDTLVGMTATKAESVDQTIQIICDEWKKLREKGATEEELAFHKKNVTGSYALNFNSTTNIVMVLLSYMQNGLSIQDINQRNQNIQKLTLQDINRVAGERLNEKDLTFVKVGRQTVHAGL